MSLTRKHFVGIAESIADAITDSESPETRRFRRVMTANTADYLATQNPGFDRDRFMEAAGFYRNGNDFT